jgi:hypothetical protein
VASRMIPVPTRSAATMTALRIDNLDMGISP